ncbi:hypothetical protein BH24PSE2_BH24PSE2_03020 [soil metagenome]
MATSDAVRVLVTCVGSGVGQSVVDSLKHRKEAYYLIGSDQNRICYPVPDCDDFVSLPPIDDAGYLHSLLRICVERRIDAVIPGHDLELSPFARNRHRFEAAGVKLIVGDAPLVELLRDKLAWSRALCERTQCVVASWSVGESRRRQGAGLTFPAVAKPSGGSASSGVKILHRIADLEGVPDDYVVQPFLFPADDDPDGAAVRMAVAAGRVAQLSEISVQLVYASDGELLGRFASRNRLKAGIPIEILPLDSLAVRSAVDEVIAALSVYEPRGPVNLQGRITGQGLQFFEMNPRFTGITGNRAQFGFNEVSALVDNFVTGEKRPLYVNAGKVGVRQVACRTWPAHRFGRGPRRERRHILVLGGTSWLARHFVAARSAGGDEVTVVCRESSLTPVERVHADRKSVQVVGSGSSSLGDRFARADVLVNCVSARPPHGTRAIVDAHVYQMRMLDVADAAEVPKIVNISSQSVYAAGAGDPKDEQAPIDAAAPYAFSKYSIEESLVSLARRRPSVSAVSLRLARLFGAADGLRTEEFPHLVVANAVADHPIELRRGCDAFDLLDIRDAVRAASFFVDEEEQGRRGEAFNVGPERPISVDDYVALVSRCCEARFGRPLRVQRHDGATPARSGIDSGRLARAGWSPACSLDQSVNELFEHFIHASG